MTQPNWGLLQNNALSHLGAGLQLGQGMTDRREAREQNNAMLDLQRQQEARLQQQEQAQTQRQQRTDQRNDAPIIGRLLEPAVDEAGWQRVRAAAPRYGIDISDMPETFDPVWREQTLMIARAVQTPEGQEALSNAARQARDAGYDIATPAGQAVVRRIIEADLAQPYTGSQGETRLYTPNVFGPGQSQGPQPGQVEDGYRFKGGDPANPNSWEPVAAGGAGPGQPGFPGY